MARSPGPQSMPCSPKAPGEKEHLGRPGSPGSCAALPRAELHAEQQVHVVAAHGQRQGEGPSPRRRGRTNYGFEREQEAPLACQPRHDEAHEVHRPVEGRMRQKKSLAWFAWERHGFCTGAAGVLRGLCMSPAWILHGCCIGSAWILRGGCMDSAWVLHGVCMESASVMHGFC